MSTLQSASEEFRAAIALEHILGRKTQYILRTLLLFLMTVSGIASAVFMYFAGGSVYPFLSGGIFLVSSGLWLEQVLIASYHNSFFFRNLNSVVGISHSPTTGVTYEVAKTVLKNPEDVTAAFCESTFGRIILLRAGIPLSRVDEYIAVTSRPRISAESITVPPTTVFTLIDLGLLLLKTDTTFKTLLEDTGIQNDTFRGALRWVIGTYHQEKRALRFWSKDNLSKTRGIGRGLSYGATYLLERYTRDIRTSAIFSTLTNNAPYAEEKIEIIETTLAKQSAANVLITGEPGVGKVDLILEIQARIETGRTLAAITGKRIIVLDTHRIIATHPDKPRLEGVLLSIFEEALAAGNVILVIENISTFINEAASLGVIVTELLDEYLSSTHLHVIATDTPHNVHQHLEPLRAFARRFTEVLIETPDRFATVRLLQPIAAREEFHFKTLFTYNALEAITTAADRYVIEGAMPDKAIRLLSEVAAEAGRQNVLSITPDFVYSIVAQKTGIPVGPITSDERDLLLHLEDELHQQVIGQSAALSAISRTMRRARAGIQAADKPIGSFLFLGPTGVGKTETAKALAKIFFGSEAAMYRLDMSEYSGSDALARLLGTSHESGTLPNMLRDHPYAVVLLDEFEKGARAVHDLFLQILDEGIFTDGRGDKVNARNTIIIATSNAGSDLIMKTVTQRQHLSHLTESIISHIISNGTFRPELINRFDSTIIFEPLTAPEQRDVVSLMLDGLKSRIEAQGYRLTIGSELLERLAQKGYDPAFGARPMQRVIQDVIEERVSRKIINGDVTKGDEIRLDVSDFSETELAV